MKSSIGQVGIKSWLKSASIEVLSASVGGKSGRTFDLVLREKITISNWCNVFVEKNVKNASNLNSEWNPNCKNSQDRVLCLWMGALWYNHRRQFNVVVVLEYHNIILEHSCLYESYALFKNYCVMGNLYLSCILKGVCVRLPPGFFFFFLQK